MSEKDKRDSIRQLTDFLRGRKGLDHESAKLEVAGASADRVEYFRAKDLVAYVKRYPERLDKHINVSKNSEDQAQEFLALLAKRRLVVACQRKFKKPKPGKKKLAKWPKTLVPCKDVASLSEEVFFAWTYDKPSGPLFYLMSFLVAVVVIAVCLFPLAPYWVRIYTLYSLTAVLGLILGLLLLRYAVWASLWCVSGHSFWVLPNVLSEEVPAAEAFTPIISFTKAESFWKSLPTRAGALLLASGVCCLLYMHHPDAETLQSKMHDAHDSVIDLIKSMGESKPGLAGNTSAPAGGARPQQQGSNSGGSARPGRPPHFSGHQQGAADL